MLALAGIAALSVGLLAAATSPLVPAAGIVALGALLAVVSRPVVGLALFIVVVATLPFGVIPVPLAGAQLTFVDAVLIVTFVGVLTRVVFGASRLTLDTPALALLAFVLIAVLAFLVGGAVSPITPELARRVGKLLA